MSEMVERAARAVDIAAHMGSPPEHWDLRAAWEQDRFRLYARAALGELMNPSEEVLRKLWCSLPARPPYNDGEVVKRVWRGIVDEILR